jgi:hypothetical protein
MNFSEKFTALVSEFLKFPTQVFTVNEYRSLRETPSLILKLGGGE